MTSSDRWRRIEEVFSAALDIPQKQRNAYLKGACGDDAGLLQEVESLLARDHEDQDDTQHPAIASIIEGTAASFFDDDAPADAMVGAELGSYRIIRELGRGGMGAVYLAVRADQAFEKQVAIKLVKRGIDTDAVLQRFWYERRILAALEHPYIARLVDGGTSSDGRPYFVMEYVDGKPLDAYARALGLSINQRCELFRKICEAVSYAHRNLIIHRDLKPANILVTSDGTPKLLDFGIARLLSIDPGEHTITGPRAPALTPDFASPEQVHGEAVTTATDVYSLGATLRAVLLSGSPPPPDLATIIGKATREESEQRYPSVAEFSEDLRRYLTGLPIMAREQTLAYQAAKFVRRHRVGVALFVSANLIAFAGISAIVWEARKAGIQRRAAEQRLSQAVGMAEQTLKDVNGSIANLPGTVEARRQMVRNTMDYLNKLSKDSGDDPRVRTALATAYMRVGEVLGNSDFPNLGDLPNSFATYQRALSVIQPLLDQDSGNAKLQLLASQAHEGAGNVLVSLGREQDAAAEYRTAISLADQALSKSPEDPDLQFQSLDAHFALDMQRYTGQPEEAEKDARQQLPLAVKLAAAQPDDLDRQNKLSEFYSLLGTVANRTSRLNGALDYYRKAAAVREAIVRQNPRNTRFQRNLLMGYGHIGDALGNPFTVCLGDYRGALEYFQKAADITEDMRRADPSDTRAAFDYAMIWTRIGATRQAAGDPKQSNADLDRAITQFEPLMAGSPGNASYSRGVGIAYEFRGRNTWLLGDRDSAMAWYQKSLAMTKKLLAGHPDDVFARSQQLADNGPISNLLALAGDRTGAIKTAGQLVKEAEDLSRNHSAIHAARGWWWYGQTYEALHDYPSAASAYAKSAEFWNKLPGLSGTPPYEAQMQEALRQGGPTPRQDRRTSAGAFQLSVTSADRWRRLEEIFLAALDMPREGRNAWLSDVCADDADLLQQVESLLADDTQAEFKESAMISGIIEGTAASLFDEDARADAMLGAQLGHYRIVREIGRGGMGAVYLAGRADQAFEKQVAIKLVKRGIDTDAILQRFWYERRILAGLEHPYIARLIDGGTSPDGRPYFVMEYVDGKPLDTYVREHTLSIRECCEIFRKVCEAVAYAHRNLIIHRDLKPANILVTADGTPKLLDFGIARLLSADPRENTFTGPTAPRALTPEFASPEQGRGDAVTTATDVYSLGSTLRAVLPSTAPLPPDLATIISKAMREETEQRFASVADLSEDLRRYLAGLPIMAREQTLVYQAAKFVRRHRLGVGVFALANLLLFAAITAIIWESRRAEMQRREAEQRLSQAVEMADQTLEEVNSSIASLPGTTEARRLMVRNTLDYLNKLSKDSGADPRVLTAMATAYVRVAEVLGNSGSPNLGDLPGSLATYQHALSVIQPLLDKDPGNLRIQLLASEAHLGLGNVLGSLGRDDKDAEAECRTAIALADRALSQSSDNATAQYHSIEAHYFLSWSRYVAHPNEAEKDMRAELPTATKLAAAHPEMLHAQRLLSDVYSLIGSAISRTNRLQESLVFYRKATEVRETLYQHDPRNTSFQRSLMLGYGHIGDVLGNPFTGSMGDYRGALVYFVKAASIAQNMIRADPSDQRASFDFAMIWMRIGATRVAAGEATQANEALGRAISQFEALMAISPGNVDYAHGVDMAYNYRARSSLLAADRAAALAWFRKSLDLADKLLAAKPGDSAARIQQVSCEGRIATLLALAGDRAGAVKLAEQAIRDSRSPGLPVVNAAQALAHAGRTYEALNDFSNAAIAYANAADAYKKVPGVLTSPQYEGDMRNATRKAAECRKKIGK